MDMAPFAGTERLSRIAFRVSLFAWLPYAVFNLLGDRAFADPFQHLVGDMSVHVRLLVSLPVLILTRKLVYRKGSLTVDHMLRSKLLFDFSQENQLRGTLEKVTNFFQAKLYPLIPLCIVILLLVVRLILRGNPHIQNWQGDFMNSEQNPSRTHLAQIWLLWVGLPIYQYLLLDWGFRIIGWTSVLWRLSRLDLRINPLHPDSRGGLAFLISPQIAFAPLCFAIASVVAIDQRTFLLQSNFSHESLLEIALTVLIPMLVVFLGPLLFFTPQLFLKKSPLLLADSRFGGVLTEEFQRRWIDPLMTSRVHETSQIPEVPQPLALDRPDSSVFIDYINIFKSAAGMKVLIFDRYSFIPFAVATLLPLGALLLVRLPLREIFHLIAKVMM